MKEQTRKIISIVLMIIGFFMFSICGYIGLFMGIGALATSANNNAYTYKTEAKIVNSVYDQGDRLLVIEYSYNGKTYQSRIESISSNRERLGATMDIRVNPDEPEYSIRDSDYVASSVFRIVSIVCIVIAVIGVGLLVWGIIWVTRVEKRIKQEERMRIMSMFANPQPQQPYYPQQPVYQQQPYYQQPYYQQPYQQYPSYPQQQPYYNNQPQQTNYPQQSQPNYPHQQYNPQNNQPEQNTPPVDNSDGSNNTSV